MCGDAILMKSSHRISEHALRRSRTCFHFWRTSPHVTMYLELPMPHTISKRGEVVHKIFCYATRQASQRFRGTSVGSVLLCSLNCLCIISSFRRSLPLKSSNESDRVIVDEGCVCNTRIAEDIISIVDADFDLVILPAVFVCTSANSFLF